MYVRTGAWKARAGAGVGKRGKGTGGGGGGSEGRMASVSVQPSAPHHQAAATMCRSGAAAPSDARSTLGHESRDTKAPGIQPEKATVLSCRVCVGWPGVCGSLGECGWKGGAAVFDSTRRFLVIKNTNRQGLKRFT